jgi:anti-sigma regulatory factor (Ser/Thr protein kinase)
MDKPFTSYQIEERSFVAFLKREIHTEVSKANFGEKTTGEIDIVVSEICSNIVKHGGGGEILYRTVRLSDEESAFEILGLDKGSGMSDPGRMMKDGVSTSRTLGHGLGAISRLSTLFQLFSLPGWGTVVYSRVTSDRSSYLKRGPLELETRGLNVPKPREKVSGDGFLEKRTDTQVRMFFGDGLGHGEHAKEATDRAKDFFFESNDDSAVDIIKGMHEHVRKTRGLVATVAILDKERNEWRVCGVGNILVRMYNGIEYRNVTPYNGTVGLNIATSMKDTVIGLEKNQHLIMCTDGIRTRWEIGKYPSIFKYDSIILAACIYKDFTRGNDDASIFIAKLT